MRQNEDGYIINEVQAAGIKESEEMEKMKMLLARKRSYMVLASNPDISDQVQPSFFLSLGLFQSFL